MKVSELIKKLEGYNQDATIAAPIWCVDDVLQQAKDDGVEIDEGEAEAVLVYMERKHDACLGISWDTITAWTDHVVCERVQIGR